MTSTHTKPSPELIRAEKFRLNRLARARVTTDVSFAQALQLVLRDEATVSISRDAQLALAWSRMVSARAGHRANSLGTRVESELIHVGRRAPAIRAPKTKPIKKITKHSRAKSPEARDLYALIRFTDRICRYCMRAPATTVDHVIPLSRGGSNRASNLVGCCAKCNHRKGSLTPREARMTLHTPNRWFLV